MAHIRNPNDSELRNFDRWVRTVAPGEDIVSALPGGRYGLWSGTSMSAPIVSGIAALVKHANPGLNLEQTVNRIEESGYSWKCPLPSRGINMETSRVNAACALSVNPTACVPPERNVCNE
jgi:subtilisin family serine protease